MLSDWDPITWTRRMQMLNDQVDAKSGLPFSIKLGGREMAPVVVWGSMALALAWVYQTQIAPRMAFNRQRRGRWVADRSLGGKMVGGLCHVCMHILTARAYTTVCVLQSRA